MISEAKLKTISVIHNVLKIKGIDGILETDKIKRCPVLYIKSSNQELVNTCLKALGFLPNTISSAFIRSSGEELTLDTVTIEKKPGLYIKLVVQSGSGEFGAGQALIKGDKILSHIAPNLNAQKLSSKYTYIDALCCLLLRRPNNLDVNITGNVLENLGFAETKRTKIKDAGKNEVRVIYARGNDGLKVAVDTNNVGKVLSNLIITYVYCGKNKA